MNRRIAVLALAFCLAAAPAWAVTIKNLTEHPVVGFIRHERGEHPLLQFVLEPGERKRLEKKVLQEGFVIQVNYASGHGRLTTPVKAELENLHCYVTIEMFEGKLSIFVDDWPPGPVEVQDPLKVDEPGIRKRYPLPEPKK
jgi:hypothetical protein